MAGEFSHQARTAWHHGLVQNAIVRHEVDVSRSSELLRRLSRAKDRVERFRACGACVRQHPKAAQLSGHWVPRSMGQPVENDQDCWNAGFVGDAMSAQAIPFAWYGKACWEKIDA